LSWWASTSGLQARISITSDSESHIDAIRNLRIALKVLKRRYGLRAVTIRET
jgi:hypothetical protein